MQQNPHLTPLEQQELAEIEARLAAAEREERGEAEEWRRQPEEVERFEN